MKGTPSRSRSISAASTRIQYGWRFTPTGVDKSEPVRQEMTRGRQLAGANGFIYSAQVPSSRPVTDYTARVIPSFPGVVIPLEVARILWQR